MKRQLFILTLALLTANLTAQTLQHSTHPFETLQLTSQQRPIPFPFLRFEDIVWSTDLWKTIEVSELFNQFFYYPEDYPNPHGKKGIAHILWDAVANDVIPIYEDDELLIPIDNQRFIERYTRADTIILELGYDDDDNELFETRITPKVFDAAAIRWYSLKETWFIGRQDTRQDSRRIALAPLEDAYRTFGNTGEEIYLGRIPLFWIPMQNPRVRTILATHPAFIDPNNIVHQPSWDWVFLNQYYHAYITRESNRHNRPILNYLTGEDALVESELIEEKVFDIENSMWEY